MMRAIRLWCVVFGVVSVFLNVVWAAENEAYTSTVSWNTHLSTSEGGIWRKRISFTIHTSNEILTKLRKQAGLKDSSDVIPPNSQEGMNTKLQPMEITFTIVTEKEERRIRQTKRSGKDENLLPLAGVQIESLRVCNDKNIEYIFGVVTEEGKPQHSGVLEAGMKIIVPIELLSIPQTAQFFIYYDNPRAWQVSDWWNIEHFGNCDFEKGTKSVEKWQLDTCDPEHNIQWIAGEGRNGSHAIKTIVAKDAEPSWIGARQLLKNVIPGERYRLTGWSKGANIEGYAGWFYHIGNAQNGMIGNGMLNAGSGTFDWKADSVEFTVPEDADRILVGTVLRGTGIAWADDCTLERISEAEEVFMPTCTVGNVEKFPLVERYPVVANTVKNVSGKVTGSTTFDAQAFFETELLPRFAFVRVWNVADTERTVLVNVSGDKISSRWGIDLNADTVQIFGLNGEPLPFEAGNGNFFIEPTLPAKSVCYLVMAEKPGAIMRKDTAHRKRAESSEDASFPGTSLQNLSVMTKSTDIATAVTSLKTVLRQNLVKNSGFEEVDANGKASDWECWPIQDGVTYNLTAPGVNREILGERCADLQIRDGVRPNWCGWRQTVAVKPGRTYFCGAWMKSPKEVASLTIHLHLFDAQHKHISSGSMISFSGRPVGLDQWSLVSNMIQMPDDAEYLSLQLTTASDVSISYDNVFVTEMEEGMPERFQGGSSGFFQVSPIVKIFPDTTWALNKEALKAYEPHTVVTAKNEAETIQFAFRYAEDRKYQVSLSPAVSKDGQTVLPTDLFVVGYVPIKHVTSYYHSYQPKWIRRLPTNNGNADGWVGRWPDPLIRFRNVKNEKHPNTPTSFTDIENAKELWKTLENATYTSDSERLCRFSEQNFLEFRASETRALQVIVTTAKDVPAGIYSGKIRFKNLETEKITFVPFSVDVKNFSIPDDPACGAIYDIRPTHPEYWNTPKPGETLSERLITFMTSKRLSSDKLDIEPKYSYNEQTGEWTADFTEFDVACEHYFNDLHVRFSYLPGNWYCFGWGLPPHKFQGEEPYEGVWPYEGVNRAVLRPEYKKIYQGKLRLLWNHLKEKGWERHFVLYISDEPFYHMPEIIVQMQACCNMIHEVDPNIPIYSSTWRHVPEWDGYITAWGIGHYGIVPEEQIKKSKARGDAIWWTTDGQMCTDTPYCATERLLPYWCMKYGAEAYEFWGASWYTINPYQYGWHSYIHQSDRPGVEYYVLYPNGDGFIFYPDKLLGIDEIVSTIRLEQAREGVEDAAYITLMRDEIERVRSLQHLTDEQTRTLKNAENTLSRVYDLVHIPNAGGRFTSQYLPNPDEVDDVKALMAQLVEELQNIH